MKAAGGCGCRRGYAYAGTWPEYRDCGTLGKSANLATQFDETGVQCRSHSAGAVGMTKGVLITLLLVGLSVPAAAAPRYPGDRGPGGIWNDGPHACRLGQSCNCHPDAYVAIRCEGTPYGPQCWWNNNCYCEPPMANQYCGSRSGPLPPFLRKRPRH
jgi:hypothetical protein